MPKSEISPYYIRDVFVCSDYVDNDASHAILHINEKLYKYIKEAQKFIKQSKSYTVSTFDYSPDFVDYLEGCKTTESLTLEDLTHNDIMNVDGLRLVVSQDSVHWEGYIKHSDPPVELYTDQIPIKEIDHNFRMIRKPLKELPLLINHCEYESSKRIAIERLNHGT